MADLRHHAMPRNTGSRFRKNLAALATANQFVAVVLQRPALAVRTLIVRLQSSDGPPGADRAGIIAGNVIAAVPVRPRANQSLDELAEYLCVAVALLFDLALRVYFIRIACRTRGVELLTANVIYVRGVHCDLPFIISCGGLW